MNGYKSVLNSGGSGTSNGIPFVVDCDPLFAGNQISCSDGTTTITATCPNSSPYRVQFQIPSGGEWTLSGSNGQDTHTEVINLPNQIYLYLPVDGATAVPTDNILTWLHCARIYNKDNYTSLSQILEDTTTLLALINNNNAADYMARSTTWATDIVSNETAMSYIGANDYCAETLLDNSIWLDSIANSAYFESVLNVKVPLMTNWSQPSGTITADGGYWSTNYPWNAFDRNTSTMWTPANDGATPAIVYDFNKNVKIYKSYLDIGGMNRNQQSTISYQYLNSSNQWITYGSFSSPASKSERKQNTTVIATPTTSKIRIIDSVGKISGYGFYVFEAQFYGRAIN